MVDNLSDLFKQCSIEMQRYGQTRPVIEHRTIFDKLRQNLLRSSISPVECLLAAASAGLYPSCQPPASLSDATSRNLFILEHLETRDFCIRIARIEDLPTLMSLEECCWPLKLRTPGTVLRQRILQYQHGQLVLVIDSKVVGVIYSQRIETVDALNGMVVDRVDSLHNEKYSVAQLLAINILPDVQQQNLGDQLLEFMLIYQSLQQTVASVVAITLCKKFDKRSGIALDDYIHLCNEQGTRVDPILRFHELHGATIERVMSGYRPFDDKNNGSGVLVRYDIQHRSRRKLQLTQPSSEKVKTSSISLRDIRHFVQNTVLACLGKQREAAFSFDRPLMEMGLDSADLLQLNESIAHQYQLPLSPTFFFQYNTTSKVVGYLAEHVADHDNSTSSQTKVKPKTAKPQSSNADTDVAIIGMACRLPGGIDTPEDFWQCLQSDTSLIGELPPERWQWPDEIEPKGQHQGIDRGGFLEQIAQFDAPFFRISPAEAQSMDPQQRILLELSWQVIEHAGYAADSLVASNTGVFIGASGSDYARISEQCQIPVDAHYGTGSSMAVLANRISYFYDLHGPSLLLDTACSSSMVAVHKAVESIRNGESTQAIVGGINLMCHPANSIAYYKAGMLSKDGLCKTFDQQANGYVRSEGAVMLFLKPLKLALAEDDQIFAVIKGSSSNHGGQASGLTVPNPEQQARLLQKAWQTADIDPNNLGYIEAHGTGTSLGDPIEIQGLKQAFSQLGAANSNEKTCALGSVKTNLGHLEAAAGITGLLKTVLCLRHKLIPASLNFRQLNEHISLSDTRFYVSEKLQSWPQIVDGGFRLAGVSSFGSGGANAHVVLAEYSAAEEDTEQEINKPLLFVLSAKSRSQLIAYGQKYRDWLQSDYGSSVSLPDLIYTLQRGRLAMEERMALIVTSRQDLIDKLTAFCSQPSKHMDTFNCKSVPEQFKGLAEGEAGQVFIRSLINQYDWDKIALLWLSGVAIDWSLLYENGDGHTGKPHRVAIPTYPFAEHQYWLTDNEYQPQQDQAQVYPVTSLQGTKDEVNPTVLAPLWRAIGSNKQQLQVRHILPVAEACVLVIGGQLEQKQAIRSVYTDMHSLAIDPSDSIDSLLEKLRPLSIIDHVVWIAPESKNTDLIAQQEVGLLYLFKLVKAFLTLGYADSKLVWSVITSGTQAVFNDYDLQPAHAGIHGFIGSLAKEYPHWLIRALDMDGEKPWPLREMLHLPCDEQGEVLAFRNGLWFRRVLCPVLQLPDPLPMYRHRGVYVVIGGAGGIGEAWSCHLIRNFQAQIIWIGRRKEDAEIKAKQAALSEFGPKPFYISADATDQSALQAAYQQIKQTWSEIHGVVHSAVGLFDHSLLEMDDQRFREVISAKIDISVNLAQVFTEQEPDFILFFSSIVALEKSGGLSGYAASGAFEDAFALHLANQLQCAVKVINWGHWDIGTGDVISEATKKRLQLSGIVPIQAEEVMPVLQQLLAAPVNQLALLKAKKIQVSPIVDQERYFKLYHDLVPSCIEQIPPLTEALSNQVEVLKPLALFNNTAMEASLLPLFAGVLNASGFTKECDIASSVPDFYRRWLLASRNRLAVLGTDQSDSNDLDQLWQRWQQAKLDSFSQPDLVAALELVESCLLALPDILSGRTRATDILFPDSSMHRVEGIYRDNAVADFFNRIVAESLASAIKIRLQQEPNARIRILEIGAGTGGTTAMVLPLLEEFRQQITEYAYTDVSKAFLFHAEEQFVGAYPFVKPMLFDVEKPLEDQEIIPQNYDFVLATNVLHATRNIQLTLDNVKAALHKNGLLVLNEISTPSLFAHLTFGLLPGWWLSEDQPLRMSEAPGLYPETWHRVLAQQGFSRVCFPLPASHELGQQIIMAESNGMVNQQKVLLPSGTESDKKVAANRSENGQVENLKLATNAYLSKLVAKALRMSSQDIDVKEPLESYGIDSILVVQITKALQEIFPDVSSTLLFECQNVASLTDYFIRNYKADLIVLTGVEQLDKVSTTIKPDAFDKKDVQGKTKATQSATESSREDKQDDAIAVIGIGCRFPQAQNAEAYWQLLKNGQDCIVEIPEQRWSLHDFYHADPDEAVLQGKSYSKWGGFLDNVTEFDPLFFNISPKEAITIDPQERIFLQTVWETLEDAGYSRERLLTECQQQVGVFAGITRTGFDLFGPDLWRQGNTLYPHTSFSSVANRVSYFLNLRGPSVPVDTMCSSSLTAIHQACQSLRNNECRLAIAGGVNIYLHPSGYVGLSASRMLSPDGVCRSFGKGGNGFVPGEGVGAVVLKPLSKAIADHDRIYATIPASHVNHGGKTNGYTVPNPQAQAELVRDALLKARVDARAVSYIEAHGTGTELGDPIEVSGLTQAFAHFTEDTGFCALGSVKSNIGHLEAAAGIAGFIKVILQMKHRQLVPSLHANELNPNIDLSKTPFVLQKTLSDWQRPQLLNQGKLTEQPLIAGISSFGAGGANAHVIVEEYRAQQPENQNRVTSNFMVLLSAKNEDRLKASANSLYRFVDRDLVSGTYMDLQNLAYTLQVGREQMDDRLALIVHSATELKQKLQAFIRGEQEVDGLFKGQAKQYKELISSFMDDDAAQQTITSWFVEDKYSRLLNLWSKGLSIDWKALYLARDDGMPSLISAPTYPFATDCYWLPTVKNLSHMKAPQLNEVASIAQEKTVPLAHSSAIQVQKDRPVPIAKPATIRLKDLTQVFDTFQPSLAATPIRLRNLETANADIIPPITSESNAYVSLYDYGAGVFAVNLDGINDKPVTVDSACTGLTRCFQQVDQLISADAEHEVAPKVIILSGLERLLTSHSGMTQDLLSTLTTITTCKCPVIAVLSAYNAQLSLLMAASCEIMLLARDGRYLFSGAPDNKLARQLFALRFGEKKAETLLAASGTLSADNLLVEMALTLPIVEPAEQKSYALELAHCIAQCSDTALAELTRHLAFDLNKLMQGSAAVSDHEESEVGCTALTMADDFDGSEAIDPGVCETIALDSNVVTLQKYANGVVVMTLCDRVSKNTFSDEFVNGVIAAFEHINEIPEYKVVILTGYDQYFACGGTKQGLLAIQSGKARFTDEQSYSMPLYCPIPVIAAMQGHAIGAGWAMGLFCDTTVYSEESIYQSPYMRYGFTPGAGSTLIFPQRLGYDLSREVLFSAREYHGNRLKQYGINSPVLPRQQVFDYAMALANHLAQFERKQLVQEKDQRNQYIRQRLAAVFDSELKMHDKTFVGQQTVIENIQRYFNDSGESHIEPVDSALNESSKTSGYSSQQLIMELSLSLAEELHMQAEQVDNDTAFIDMGMDSITAVTWIRKVNRQFGLEIGATSVYSYPSLNLFVDFVQAQLPQKQPLQTKEQVEPAKVSDDALLSWLRQSLAKELLMSPEMIDEDSKFIDIGLDSITAVTWIRSINKYYGLSVGATKVYSYPTLAEFCQYLLDLGLDSCQSNDCMSASSIETSAIEKPTQCQDLSEPVLRYSFPLTELTSTINRTDEAEPTEDKLSQQSKCNDGLQSIAIIGMSGQFPKAENIDQFWQNLLQGRDCISDIPETRWSIENYYDPDRNSPGKTVCKRMGVLEDIDVFDPLFFNISPSEAEYMDPQQRVFLQNSWRCIEDAGYDPNDFSSALCGVFVGCAVSDYAQLTSDHDNTAYALLGESVSMLPARIAYFLNLQGPCMAIDTACSSSLVALANACDSLALGHCDTALAGGVYIINGPDIQVKMSKAGMLSSDGCCFTFDQRANGFVPGEGVGVLLLKRLDQAEADGDDIYGVIRGWGVNQDGKSNGITAPNQQAQTRLETSVYEKFDINPEHIQLVEAHGTGTKLGDPIEVEALCNSFRQFTDKQHYCALGSVKSNIGHLATAAGVSGIFKALLALNQKQLPPTIHYQTLNEHIDLNDSPFYVNTQCQSWPEPISGKALAAVSSFGFSGTNAHMVLAEADARPGSVVDHPVLLVLSAKTEAQLLLYVRKVSDYLLNDYDKHGFGLADLAYTFQTGRAEMQYRLAIVASNVDDLNARLLAYSKGDAEDENCMTGQVANKASAEVSNSHIKVEPDNISEQKLRQLAQTWVTGAVIDWAVLYPSEQVRRRHGLPTYPFAQERYWLPELESVEDSSDEVILSASEDSEIATELWHDSALDTAIDWQQQLQLLQHKYVIVIYSDEDDRQAFHRLWLQLRQAAGLNGVGSDSKNVHYLPFSKIDSISISKQPDCILFMFGQMDSRNALLSLIEHGLGLCLSADNDKPVQPLLSLTMKQSEAESLFDEISVNLRKQLGGLLLTQSLRLDRTEVLQNLFKELLAMLAEPQLTNSLAQVHYANGQRLLRNEILIIPESMTQDFGSTAAPEKQAHSRLRNCFSGAAVESKDKSDSGIIKFSFPRHPTEVETDDQVYLIDKCWREKTLPTVEQNKRNGSVLVLVNHESLAVAQDLLMPDDFNEIILIGDDSITPNQIQNSINYKDAESARMSAKILIDQYDDIGHIIDLGDLYDSAVDKDTDNPGKIIFYQTIIATYNDISLLYFTKELQSFKSRKMSLAGAKFAGLVKMISADYPHIDARLIDIDQATFDQPPQIRQIILQEFADKLQETELCYRDGQRYAPMLIKKASTNQTPVPIAQDGVYVISGGTNGVGLEIAQYLASQGCSKLVLMGVTELPSKQNWLQAINDENLSSYVRQKLSILIELDNKVEHLQIYTGSMTSFYSLKTFFKKIRSKLGTIRGVIHAAGVYSDPETPGFAEKSLESMQRVWEPKIKGLETLHALFNRDSLDFFVSFSSMTGLMPHLARGASDYAMANSFVDFFTAYQFHQNQQSHYKTVIWSDWNQAGAITRIAPERVAMVKENFKHLGMRTFSNQEGHQLFEHAMNANTGSTVVVGFLEWKRFDSMAAQLLYSRVDINRIQQADDSKTEAEASNPEISILYHLEQWEAEKRSGLEVPIHRINDVISIEQIKQLPPHLIHRVHKLLFSAVTQQSGKQVDLDLEQVISATVQEVLKLNSFDPAQPFQDYGLDSISAMVLATRLEKKLQQPVKPQWLIDYATVAALSKKLSGAEGTGMTKTGK